MTDAKKNPKPKSIEQEIELHASPDVIWQALTDSQELTRWFPLTARVEPGKGGKIFLSWGPEWEDSASIDI